MPGPKRSKKGGTKRKGSTKPHGDPDVEPNKKHRGSKKAEKDDEEEKDEGLTPAEFVKAVNAKLLKKEGWVKAKNARGADVLAKTSHCTDKGCKQCWKNTKKKKHLLAAAFERTHNVSDPKSYGKSRIKQAMRWIATAAVDYLRSKGVEPEEVQATLDGKGNLVIAANKNSANDELEALAERAGTGKAMLKEMLEERKAKIEAGDEEDEKKGKGPKDETPDYRDRRKRHVTKGVHRLVEGNGKAADYEGVTDALDKPVTVAKKGEKGKLEDGMHAERRLKAHLGDEFDAETVGGTMRPCVACYIKLYADPKDKDVHHPGLCWCTKNAMTPATNDKKRFSQEEVDDFADKIDEEVDSTYATHTHSNDDVTPNYDTDSDSPASE
jgi:hypothetical protein